MSKHRQTVSYLTKRFREVGLFPNSRHGQNFLIDLNLIELLARSAEVNKNDVVLEVGTGTGSLTGLLAEKAACVITVEIDNHLYQLAREELEDAKNVVMLHQDALRNKNNLHPRVIETVKEHLAVGTNRRLKLAANLPYNIATPILSNLLKSEIVPDTMTVTIQKELADRITATPNSKDYNSLSIWMQAVADTELIRVMPPSVFWPRPKVHSAIIRITHRPDKRARIADVDFFLKFIRAMFFHRRKFLRSVVISAFKGKLNKPDVDEVLNAMQLGPNTRAEQLSVETMIEMADRFRARVSSAAQ